MYLKHSCSIHGDNDVSLKASRFVDAELVTQWQIKSSTWKTSSLHTYLLLPLNAADIRFVAFCSWCCLYHIYLLIWLTALLTDFLLFLCVTLCENCTDRPSPKIAVQYNRKERRAIFPNLASFLPSICEFRYRENWKQIGNLMAQ